MQRRFENLFNILEEILRLALEKISVGLAQQPVPTRLRRQIERDGDSISYQILSEPDAGSLVLRAWDALQEIPQLEALRKALEEANPDQPAFLDPRGGTISDIDVQRTWTFRFWLLPLLTEYLADGDLSFNESKFERVYRLMEEFLAKDSVTRTTFVTLENLRLAPNEVQISPNMRLRRATPEELRRLGSLGLEVPGNFQGIDSAESGLEVSDSVLRTELYKASVNVEPLVSRVLTSLRLVKEGALSRGWALHSTKPRIFGLPTVTESITGPGAGLHYATPYVLDTQINEFLVLFGALDLESEGTLKVALDRLNFASERHRAQDRLIDHWIALEALFLPDARDELRYRASLRITRYVESEPSNRPDVFVRVRDSYDARSTLVHGGTVRNLQEIESFTASTLRKAIKQAVTKAPELDVPAIDAAIARGDS